MKLIYKHGNIDPERTRAYKVVCPNCGCEFYAANHDFKWREKSINGKAGILCPDCELEIVFKPSDCMIDVHEDPDCMVFQDNVEKHRAFTADDIKNILEDKGDYCGNTLSCLGPGSFRFGEEQLKKAAQEVYNYIVDKIKE